jgi:hypothetical protein
MFDTSVQTDDPDDSTDDSGASLQVDDPDVTCVDGDSEDILLLGTEGKKNVLDALCW